MQTLLTGSLLQHGTYRIEKVLGQGGFGITYLATDLNLQRKVAIKEFFPKDFCDRNEATSQVTLGTKNTAEFVNRLKSKFLKEARNIAQFDHPNIIRIYAAFEENNTAYYVMEYIEGESLSSIVKKSGPLPEKRALGYIAKVGEALEYVHERKINHLDIKPANIMVRKSDDSPILIDFGLSKQYDSDGNQTSTMPPGFSHGFAPLEQYNEGGVKDFTPQTDIYSLAATLYYVLSGVVPIQATRRNDEELTFPNSIPQKMVAAISKAMSPGRKGRHSEVLEFIKDIKRVESVSDDTQVFDQHKVKEQQIQSDSKSQINKPIKPTPKPYKWNIYIITAIVIAVMAGSIWFLSKSPQPIDDEEIETVSNMEWVSPLGDSMYSGELMNDTLSNGEVKAIPNGKGLAKIVKGNFAGAIYEGDFVMGKMEGNATYTLSNGDVFTGSFHRNQFDEGRYLDKESGEYFEGSFRDMQPYKGKWYSSNGKVIEEIK
ncbi:MAG: protein kinase [Bacteroides sp.]|nr:protein kinase [Bacteroides sp.]